MKDRPPPMLMCTFSLSSHLVAAASTNDGDSYYYSNLEWIGTCPCWLAGGKRKATWWSR